MNVPDKVENLIYTPHAQRARCTDEFGLIEHVPKNFYKAGCKKCFVRDGDIIKVIYAYDDNFDLALIINSKTRVVVTLYRYPMNNKGGIQGRFFNQFARRK